MARALIVVLAWAACAPVSGAPPAGAAACSGCHAATAQAAGAVPRIAGLDAADILRAMQEFRSGSRPATVMDRIARGFTDEEAQAIAEWYARRK